MSTSELLKRALPSIREASELIANNYCPDDDTLSLEVRRLTEVISSAIESNFTAPAPSPAAPDGGAETKCTCPKQSHTVGIWTARYRVRDCPVHGELANPEYWQGRSETFSLSGVHKGEFAPLPACDARAAAEEIYRLCEAGASVSIPTLREIESIISKHCSGAQAENSS